MHFPLAASTMSVATLGATVCFQGLSCCTVDYGSALHSPKKKNQTHYFVTMRKDQNQRPGSCDYEKIKWV